MNFFQCRILNMFPKRVPFTKISRKIGLQTSIENGLEELKPFSDQSPLTDAFGRFHNYLRISLTEKCNLRCKYCMPEEGVPLSPAANILSQNEIFRLVRIFAALGVNKVRLTGGEPTIRKDLLQIVENIASVPTIKQIGVTSNGVVLGRQLVSLWKAGLNRLDTLNEQKFVEITRRNAFGRVMNLITLAETMFDPVKINCVVMRGFNDDEMVDFVGLTEKLNVDVRFIEFMPFGGNDFDEKRMVPYREILARIFEKYGEDVVKLTDEPNDTSKSYKIQTFKGKFGFISSMSEHFCGTCNRLRITADGNLKVCLHGNAEGLYVFTKYAFEFSFASRCHARKCVGRRSHFSNSKICSGEKVSTRGDGKSYANDQQTNDFDRRLTQMQFTDIHFVHDDLTHNSIKSQKNWLPLLNPSQKLGVFLVANLADLVSSRRLSTSQMLFNCRFYHSTTIFVPQHQRFFHNTNSLGERLTHFNEKGQASMVDISDKAHTTRTALAQTIVKFPLEFFDCNEVRSPKGDLFGTARIAGIQAAKKTAELIPLCHQIALDKNIAQITVFCRAKSSKSQTGVEMEALVGCSVAALTIYDMCKALGYGISIERTELLGKCGGKRNFGFTELPSSKTDD